MRTTLVFLALLLVGCGGTISQNHIFNSHQQPFFAKPPMLPPMKAPPYKSYDYLRQQGYDEFWETENRRMHENLLRGLVY